ncbi:hypothetical protein A1C50_RS07155 [Acinetobacter baumannii]|uniref:hypothetical protein n=1 Tax=Acinetobacter TaxID=469 RepID=UPI00031797F3|nr:MULTISPECIES: hypothetical protein [Acinetobacter]UJQ43469.1 hypothetical protein [Acinetobacter phage vB_AbM_WUPSU]AVZ05131.1 hypothetical protein DBQ26_11135 [Acinetobacter pittii]EHU2363133.1 hypothetical protein [Acinetobacter baumannii]EKV6547423.1 hypothetical protein [Acinetobacter baumannii]EKX0165990.1 hypothetical protein [Acinetobacter baumannii]
MHKYDWSTIPVEANWAATDANGLTCCYTTKPFMWGNEWLVKELDEVVLCYRSEPKEDWQDSLEQRPKGASHE